MRDGKIEFSGVESEWRCAVLRQEPFAVRIQQFANCAVSTFNRRNVFNL